ncbi:hypothetical protein [Streptomyces malaysiense]|uniref:Uncharacterized protein n=1 Tax=Streptomyces malaysiense TaxID=1428626 RepID=A0A1J4PRY3_9ACTN|nr:hypothetical protein [Streptomyces malaysiense]OIK23667.1 hypothetical protein VT52_031365 [Streptomyces malaysiense]
MTSENAPATRSGTVLGTPGGPHAPYAGRHRVPPDPLRADPGPTAVGTPAGPAGRRPGHATGVRRREPSRAPGRLPAGAPGAG